MGACLTVLAESVPFAVEARTESFYVSTSALNAPVMRGREHDGDPAFALKVSDLAPFRAALEQVHRFGKGASKVSRLAERDALPIDPWTVELVDNEVIVQGPAHVYGVTAEWARTDTIEVRYALLNHLRAALAAVAE